jgi:flagellar motility protein MotE (MotC chaperone)
MAILRTLTDTLVGTYTPSHRWLYITLSAGALVVALVGLRGFPGRGPFLEVGANMANAGEKAAAAPAREKTPALAAGEKTPEGREAPTPQKTERLLTLSAGDIPVLQSMQERQAHLDERERQLTRREEELRGIQQRLEEKLALLTTLRKEVGALMEEKDAFEEKRFEHLVKVYEGMKAEEAAALFERLQEETAVKMLFRMKEKKVSQILGVLKPEVAVKLSERLTVQRQKESPKGSDKEKS